MAASYGFDISQPAKNVQEAIQWLYFGYLAAVKEQNGAESRMLEGYRKLSQKQKQSIDFVIENYNER